MWQWCWRLDSLLHNCNGLPDTSITPHSAKPSNLISFVGLRSESDRNPYLVWLVGSLCFFIFFHAIFYPKRREKKIFCWSFTFRISKATVISSLLITFFGCLFFTYWSFTSFCCFFLPSIISSPSLSIKRFSDYLNEKAPKTTAMINFLFSFSFPRWKQMSS